MAKGTQTNKLEFLGESFQLKLVHEFVEDKEFFKDLCDIIDQNMFTDANIKTFVGVMREYYKKYQIVPGYDEIKISLRNKAHNDIEIEYYDALVDKVHNTTSEGVGQTRELAEKFFKQQNMIRCAHEIIDIASKGNADDYDKCVEILTKALLQGTNEDLGACVFDNENETLSEDYRTAIPTGIGKIDETLEGGLGKGELGVVVGSSSFGKAQPLTSRILTPNGYKLMGDMQIGDYVIGGDGKPHRISGVFPQGIRPIYKVTFSNGTSCECDIEHLWNVNSLYQRCGKKYIPGVSKNRDDKHYAPDHSFKTLSLREIIDKGLIKQSKKYNFKVPVVKPIEFEESETKFDPYLVGYYIGDGSYERVEISVGKTKNALKESFDIGCKSDSKEIPSEYIFNSVENRIALLQGLMDSDGYANKNGSCEFCSKSKKLAEQVQFIVRSLGGFASLIESNSSYFSKKENKRIDCGKRYRVTISMCDKSIKLFRFKRKQDRVKYRTRGASMLYMVSAEYVGEKEAQCIMVDSDEHLYITEDFIVTHNTSLTTAMASYAATYKCSQNNNDGFKVLQIVFEDRIKQIQRKHIGRITGIEAKDLSKPGIVDKVKEQLEKYPDRETLQKNLRIIRLPSGEKTANDIKRLIVKLKNSGFSPDMVIVDYFECLKCTGDSSDDKWEKEGKTMRRFESIAGELNIAIWIPVQGTKDSLNAEVVTMDKAGGSFKKIQIAHIVMSIARTVEDIESNLATIAILKNRAGKAGKVFNGVEFNNGTCRISTDHIDEYDTQAAFVRKQENDSAERQRSVMAMVMNAQKNK